MKKKFQTKVRNDEPSNLEMSFIKLKLRVQGLNVFRFPELSS